MKTKRTQHHTCREESSRSCQPPATKPAGSKAEANNTAQTRSTSLKVHVGPQEDDGGRDVAVCRGEEVLQQAHIDVTKPEERAGLIGRVTDALDLSATDEQALHRLMVEQAAIVDQELKAAAEARRHSSQPERSSMSTQLLKLIDDAEFFHSQDHTAYATIEEQGKIHTLRIDGKSFSRLLIGRYLDEYERSPSQTALTEAIMTLEAKAVHHGPCRKVFVRYAEHDGNIYVDLANDESSFVEIRPDGWSMCQSPPVSFVRPQSMLPLPTPRRGGSIQLLDKYVNIAERDWPLFAGFVLSAAMPKGPYPVLVLQGGQGTAKSTTMRMLANVIDPRIAGQRSDIRRPEDLQIAAANGHLLCLDNLSHVGSDTSDAICRLATGGGYGTRRLYTDTEETLIEVSRPVALNGISELVTQGDLLDRSFVLYLPSIDGALRVSEAELKRGFEADLPLILGGLYDAMAASLRNRGTVKLASQPRMLDVAIQVTAAEAELGLEAGEFMNAYDDNRATSHLLGLETHPVGRLLCEFLSSLGLETRIWTGTATELLEELGRRAAAEDKHHQHWPANAKALSDRLRRLEPHLRHIGVSIEFRPTKKSRRMILTKLEGFEQNWLQMSGAQILDEDK